MQKNTGKLFATLYFMLACLCSHAAPVTFSAAVAAQKDMVVSVINKEQCPRPPAVMQAMPALVHATCGLEPPSLVIHWRRTLFDDGIVQKAIPLTPAGMWQYPTDRPDSSISTGNLTWAVRIYREGMDVARGIWAIQVLPHPFHAYTFGTCMLAAMSIICPWSFYDGYRNHRRGMAQYLVARAEYTARAAAGVAARAAANWALMRDHAMEVQAYEAAMRDYAAQMQAHHAAMALQALEEGQLHFIQRHGAGGG